MEEYRLNADEELRFEVEANATVQMEVSALYRGKIPIVQLEIIYNYLVLTIDEVNIQLPSIDY